MNNIRPPAGWNAALPGKQAPVAVPRANKQSRLSKSVRIRGIFSMALLMISGLVACTRKAPVTNSNVQIGTASWYGKPFDGRRTASGEVYNMEKMTAAHRTLPFGATVRVQNLVNQKTTEVRINDRGPFVGDRIIDLSHTAAVAIDMPGTANVRLEVLSTPPTRGAEMFVVQIGNFAQRLEAQRLMTDMRQRYGTARLIFREGDQTWRVLVGLEPTMEQAQTLAQQMEKESGPAFVVRIDTEQ